MKEHVFTPLEKHLQAHWKELFTISDLVALGFGNTSSVQYQLNKSRYAYKVAYGVYKFSPFYRDDMKATKEAIVELLSKNDSLSLVEIANKLKLSIHTIENNISVLRKEGYLIEKITKYRLNTEG